MGLEGFQLDGTVQCPLFHVFQYRVKAHIGSIKWQVSIDRHTNYIECGIVFNWTHSSAPDSLHSSAVNYVGLSALIVPVGYAEMSVNKIVIKRYAVCYFIVSFMHDSRCSNKCSMLIVAPWKITQQPAFRATLVYYFASQSFVGSLDITFH